MLSTVSKYNRQPSRRTWLLLTAAAAVVLALPTLRLSRVMNARADDAPTASVVESPAKKSPEFLPVPTPLEKKILEALDRPVTLSFVEMPLGDVIDYLRNSGKVNIVLDERALRNRGARISADTPMTVELEDVRLRSALWLILRKLNLTFTVQNDVLLITTEEEARLNLTTRTYPVGDLFHATDGFKDLVEAIQTTVLPESWEQRGGQGTMVVVKKSDSLVIRQTFRNQEKTLELLRSLRKAGRKTATKR